MKAVVAAFNQEKALVGAFSVIIQLQTLRRFVSSFTFSLHSSCWGLVSCSKLIFSPSPEKNKHFSQLPWVSGRLLTITTRFETKEIIRTKSRHCYRQNCLKACCVCMYEPNAIREAIEQKQWGMFSRCEEKLTIWERCISKQDHSVLSNLWWQCFNDVKCFLPATSRWEIVLDCLTDVLNILTARSARLWVMIASLH